MATFCGDLISPTHGIRTNGQGTLEKEVLHIPDHVGGGDVMTSVPQQVLSRVANRSKI